MGFTGRTLRRRFSEGPPDRATGLPDVAWLHSPIHGLGTGALRDAVRGDSAGHPLVRAVRPGERGEGGDGVTVVDLG